MPAFFIPEGPEYHQFLQYVKYWRIINLMTRKTGIFWFRAQTRDIMWKR